MKITKATKRKATAAVRSSDLLGAFAPVSDWYGGDGNRPLHEMLADAVADLQHDRAAVLQMSAALRKIVNEFDTLNGMECSRGCGKCIRCIARTALGSPKKYVI